MVFQSRGIALPCPFPGGVRKYISLAPAGQMGREGIYVIILKMRVNELTFDFFIKMSAIT